MGGQVQPARQPVPAVTRTGLGGGVVTTSVLPRVEAPWAMDP